MKVTPQISADLEDYPELARLYDTAIRRVVELMQIHDIAELRRIRKTGVFDHQYTKDVVNPIGVETAPGSVQAVRYAVGGALLDYLGAIGISGITLEVSDAERQGVGGLWTSKAERAEQQAQADPADPAKPAKPADGSSVETREDAGPEEKKDKE